jgi:hypothetical protein
VSDDDRRRPVTRVQQYLVSVTVSVEDERFYLGTGGDEWTADIQSSLDALSDDVADDNFDDHGRMSVSFDVKRLPDVHVLMDNV